MNYYNITVYYHKAIAISSYSLLLEQRKLQGSFNFVLLLNMYAFRQPKVFEYLFKIGFEALRELSVNGYGKLDSDLEVRTLPAGRHGAA